MKTAVGFLQNAIDKYIDYVEGSHKAEQFTITQLSEAVQQAKEIEKQQIVDAWDNGNFNTDLKGNPSANYAITAEHYYNQKYKNETTEKLE